MFRLFAWHDRRTSTAAFLLGFAVWFSHTLHGYSLPGISLHIAFGYLAYSFIIALKNALFEGPKTTPPQINWVVELVGKLSVTAAAATSGLTEKGNAILAWSDGPSSLWWAASVWLAARGSFLFTPALVLTAWVAVFVAAPAYELRHAAVDAFIGSLGAVVFSLQTHVRGAKAAVRSVFESNRTFSVAGSFFLSIALLYVLWGVLSLTTILNILSSAVLLVEAVDSFGAVKPALKKE